MNQYTKTMVTFGVLILILFGLYYFSDWFSKTTGYVLGEDEKVKLAVCLNSKNALLYSSSSCNDCEKQLDLFGKEASKFLTVFTCQNVGECPEGGVPAWKINGQTYYGVKQLGELIALSGCEVK